MAQAWGSLYGVIIRCLGHDVVHCAVLVSIGDIRRRRLLSFRCGTVEGFGTWRSLLSAELKTMLSFGG